MMGARPTNELMVTKKTIKRRICDMVKTKVPGEKDKKEDKGGETDVKGNEPMGERREMDEMERRPYPFFGGRRRWPGAFNMMNDDLLRDFEREFKRMHDEMDRMFQDAMKNAQESDPEKGGPIVYGWSMRVGPDGKPQFQKFGNTRGLGMYSGREAQRFLGTGDCDGEDGDRSGWEGECDGAEDIISGCREPLTDIIEDKDNVCITAELPGVEKSDINLDAFSDRLTIKVDTEQRKYFKEVSLPAEVQPDSIEASFKNGVLDVTVKKKKEAARKGKRVSID